MKKILKTKKILRILNKKEYLGNITSSKIIKIEKKLNLGDDKIKIVEFFQKNFQGNKTELVTTFGKDFPFIEIKETTEEIYKIIEYRNYKKKKYPTQLEDKMSVTIPFIGYLPGSGKSKNAKELMSVLQKMDKEKENILQNGVQILIRFGEENLLTESEKEDIEKTFSIRMLLGYFGLGDFIFSDAIEFIHKKIDTKWMDISDAIDIILLDLKNNENAYFVVSIDVWFG
jgi:hypothetical protein